MKERNRRFIDTTQLTIQAYDQGDAIKRAREAVEDGLIEPGFVVDGLIEQEQIEEVKQ